MLIATACFLLSGIIKGTVGVGLPIAAVGLMVLFIGPRLAMSLMVFPIMFANIWQTFSGGTIKRVYKKYLLFAVILAVSLYVTTSFTPGIAPDTLVLFVGIVIIIFALMNLMFNPPPMPVRFHRPAAVVASLCAGIMGGLTAIWSPPIAAYMIATNTEKDEFVCATGMLFLVGSVPLCIGFWNNGLMTGPTALVSAAMIIPTLIGFAIGEAIRRRLNPDRFKKVVLVVFFLIGINLIRRVVFGS